MNPEHREQGLRFDLEDVEAALRRGQPDLALTIARHALKKHDQRREAVRSKEAG